MIPQFNVSGVLPPFINDDPTNIVNVSPYKVTLGDFVQHFATSPERILLLRGFINYRLKMKSLGFNTGFQWIDGSFVENIEKTQNRPPADIDLVTFSELPSKIRSEDEINELFDNNQDIFDNDLSKIEFMCDAFHVNLCTHPVYLIEQTRYWFGLFSHQRSTSLWKGIIEIDFTDDETIALELLTEGGNIDAS
ncbi:DUF6932 family protein [Photobacterium leiognathi]|uniref:DUF6932 family protein n=1 Tax=Photobacterium leiognathi TaxID=553611 RepID=UPI002982463E|nr:hypothetical protein [Photobacterium leiognathi]